MVFDLDHESIIGIWATLDLDSGSSPSITPCPTPKQKQDEVDGSSQDIILLLETFKRLTTILAEVLVKIEKISSLSIRQAAPVVSIESLKRAFDSKLATGLNDLAQIHYNKISNMEYYIEEKIDYWYNNI